MQRIPRATSARKGEVPPAERFRSLADMAVTLSKLLAAVLSLMTGCG